MVAVTKRIGHINSVEATVEIQNRGATETTKTVELLTGTTTVDSQSITLAVGETVTTTLSDSTFGQAEIGSTRRYEVVTGGREPLIDANIIAAFKVPAGIQKEIPSLEISEVRIEKTGELHFDQTDELKLSVLGVLEVPAGTIKKIPPLDVLKIEIEQTGKIDFDQTDKLKLSQT